MKIEFLCYVSQHSLSFLQAACPTSSVPCCIRSVFGFCQILIHVQQSSDSFISSSLARSSPSSCTWSFSRPVAYLQTAPKKTVLLKPRHHVCVTQKTDPFFLAAFFSCSYFFKDSLSICSQSGWEREIFDHLSLRKWYSIWGNTVLEFHLKK